MLFPVRQRLRSSLPVGLLVVALGVNATASAVNAWQIAELATACGRSAVIAANHLEPNGTGKIRLAADAFRMTNAILALFNHSNDGGTSPYFYNGWWGACDTAAFVQHLQATSSDEIVGVEPSTDQEADETFERIALVLLNDILPVIETAASIGVAVNGMLDENRENPKLRICLQSLTSLSRTWQTYLENRNTPEARMYFGAAVAHAVATLWEAFRDLNPVATTPTPTLAQVASTAASSAAATTTAATTSTPTVTNSSSAGATAVPATITNPVSPTPAPTQSTAPSAAATTTAATASTPAVANSSSAGATAVPATITNPVNSTPVPTRSTASSTNPTATTVATTQTPAVNEEAVWLALHHDVTECSQRAERAVRDANRQVQRHPTDQAALRRLQDAQDLRESFQTRAALVQRRPGNIPGMVFAAIEEAQDNDRQTLDNHFPVPRVVTVTDITGHENADNATLDALEMQQNRDSVVGRPARFAAPEISTAATEPLVETASVPASVAVFATGNVASAGSFASAATTVSVPAVIETKTEETVAVTTSALATPLAASSAAASSSAAMAAMSPVDSSTGSASASTSAPATSTTAPSASAATTTALANALDLVMQPNSNQSAAASTVNAAATAPAPAATAQPEESLRVIVVPPAETPSMPIAAPTPIATPMGSGLSSLQLPPINPMQNPAPSVRPVAEVPTVISDVHPSLASSTNSASTSASAPVTLPVVASTTASSSVASSSVATATEIPPVTISTGSASISTSASSQTSTATPGRISPRADTPEDDEEIGMNKQTTKRAGKGRQTPVDEQKKKTKRSPRARRI